jgi:hypothetical protein
MTILFKVLTRKHVIDGASQFRDIYVNFKKFYVLSSQVHTECREWLWLWLFRAIPWRWWRISQSHCMSNRWWNLGFIFECWNQKSSQSSGSTHIHQTGRRSLNKCCLPARKLVAAVVLGRKGVLTVEFMQQGTTMWEVYCKTLKKTV